MSSEENASTGLQGSSLPANSFPGEKSALAKKIVEKRAQLETNPESAHHCFIGFDGFTDDIVIAVDTRDEAGRITPIRSMEQFGERIASAARKSCNIELMPHCCKIGGNAPIMTSALLEGGHRITFVGAIGHHANVEPLFGEMARRCELAIPLCPSAHSDAIEFEDGKVIMGKLTHLADLSYESILNRISQRTLVQLLERSTLLVCANWTMMPMMNEFWRTLESEILPEMEPLPHHRQRLLFVDLADPTKRPDSDLSEALSLLQRLGKEYQVYLGLNSAEAERVLKRSRGKRGAGSTGESSLAFDGLLSDPESARLAARQIAEAHALHTVIVHGLYGAAAASLDGAEEYIATAYCKHPAIQTGAGDNFNGGFCNGRLYDLSLRENLLLGVATAGYYVRKGHSPTIHQLAEFLTLWEESPEALDSLVEMAK